MLVALPLCFGAAVPVHAAKTTDADLERRFNDTVRPFVKTYCIGCHGGSTPVASFDLQQFTTLQSVVRGHAHWALVLEKITSKEMPPAEAKQPSDAVRQRIINWMGEVGRNEARKHAGDPGEVLARRLSNAEYNNTIRDLTGVDLRPAREFPVDPANQAGFDNSAESLIMSPGLMDKYLQAARNVADHMVLKPNGFDFAPHPMLVETDREKYSVQRIVNFYDSQPTDFAEYFQAAWRFKHRAALGKPRATLAAIAADSKVSPKYLPMVWQALEETREDVGPLAKLQAMWRELPAPKGNQPDLARAGTIQMRDFVRKIRRHTAKLITSPTAPGLNGNSQPMIHWRNSQIAATHRDFDPTALRVEGEPPAADIIVTRGPTFGGGEAQALKKAVAEYIKERQEDPDLVVPAGQRAKYEAAFARFSSVFPDKFALRERGRFYPIDALDEGRFLSAGLHNVMGYFRDDVTLIDLILDEKGKKELDTLWEEFEFISEYTVKTHLQFVFNGGGGGRGINVPRPTFAEATTEKTIFRYRDEYLLRTAEANNPVIAQAIRDFFGSVNSSIRWVEHARVAAEPKHLEALLKFAARAYRRPIEQDEREEILAYYRELRDKSNLSHEEAMRASIVSLLVSPDFCYRIDMTETRPAASSLNAKMAAAVPTKPLSPYALASRLSYFLWSSMPDDELFARAAAGDLTKPAVLAAQVR
ncbi:MAG TPA: DUF1587 domain-containing protein, partial [Bryobacteraceae bacterium]|nr:DUF1587 domain-containing protein [Bryobacteraceae bacterium]